MIAQVVFDLPLDGPFDYIIPESMRMQVAIGHRVRASFGPRLLTGYVIGLLEHSTIKTLKPLKKSIDAKPIFDQHDIKLCQEFASYYGISLGEALTSFLREAKTRHLAPPPPTPNTLEFHEILDGNYHQAIESIVRRYEGEGGHSVVCVPDMFYLNRFVPLTKTHPALLLVTRSGLHHARGAKVLIVIDEDNASYQQEQTPAYHARVLVGMISKHFGLPIVMIGVTPSIEVKALIESKQMKHVLISCQRKPVMVVDMSNYMSKGLLSPASLSSIDQYLKSNGRVGLLLNRKGNYAVTKCSGCGQIVECPRCSGSLVYDKASDHFSCRSCTDTVNAQNLKCVACHGREFTRIGVGISQFKNHLIKLFPQSSVATWQHEKKPQPTPTAKVIVGTQALVSLLGRVHFNAIVLIDIDRDINRLDMNSSFDAWSLVEHLRLMSDQVIVQTRQPQVDMLKAMALDNREMMYQSEMRIRRELGFSPYAHWLRVTVRGPVEVSVREVIDELHAKIDAHLPQGMIVHTPCVDNIARKRDQYRYIILMQGPNVIDLVKHVKQAQIGIKRHKKMYITLKVD